MRALTAPALLAALAGCLFSSPLAAQDALEAQTGEPPERIDLTIEPPENEEALENCSDDQDAATITGEIVVCRRRTGEENRLYDKQTAERRHAERTKGPMPVDVAGPGIFRGAPTMGGMCFIPPCPKDPVYLIDFAELPDTPAGSDADRAARGLAPRGDRRTETEATIVAGEPGLQSNAEELGLPEPLAEPEAVSPSGSASPADDPSD